MKDFLGGPVFKIPLSNGVLGVQIQSLARELRLHMLWGMTQKLKKKKSCKEWEKWCIYISEHNIGPECQLDKQAFFFFYH